MNEPLFLTKEEVLKYHTQLVALLGGLPGLGFVQVPDRRRLSNKSTLTLTLSRPTGAGTARSISRSFLSGWIRRQTEDDSPSHIRVCLALHCVHFSLSSPEGGEGRGEEAALPGEARIPPSPTLPPLVPRGERETFVEYAKHILHPNGGEGVTRCGSDSQQLSNCASSLACRSS